MSSKTVDNRARGGAASISLATRMTLWYALSAFAMVLTATGFLYRALSVGLAHEDDVLLSQNVADLRLDLQKPGDEIEDLRQQLAQVGSSRRSDWLWLRILDGSGKTFLETPGMSQILPSGLFPAPSAPGATPGGSREIRSALRRPFRAMAAQVDWPGHRPSLATLQVAVDMSSDEEILGKFRAWLWLVLGLSLLACALAGYWIAHSGIRPVEEMANTAARIRSTNLHERLEKAGLPSELSDLAATFNEMLDRLEDSFNRLSRFSTDIAHELRTPLQNLRVQAEVALSKERGTVEYRDLLGSCLEEYGRLSNLIDRLLFLARAENPETQIQREKVDLKRELEILGDFYESSAAESGVRLEAEAPEGLSLSADRPLFQRAVGNLVENALKHTPDGGSIRLKAVEAGKAVRVEVSDTGPGIPADQLPRLFDRFYRVDPSRSPASGGAGLGLSIVRSILSLHGGTVEIKSQEGRGTTVVLSFPAR